MIEHWAHLICAGISSAQYTDIWTCHLHKESGLTTQTYTTPPIQTLVQATYPLHTYTHHRNTDTSNTPPVSTGLVKPKSNALIHSLAPLSPPTPHRVKHIHISHTNSSHPTYHTHPYDVNGARHNT